MRTRTKHFAKRTSHTLLVLSCLSYFNSALAEDVIAGKTLLAKGKVTAVNPNTNDTRALKRRSKIMSVEHITTGENSKAQFSMSDGGLITLKENTEINVNNYVFNDETQQGSATLEVISGGLRSISGLIKKNGGDYQVKTPVGSIGIRGTHFAVEVSGDDVYFGVYSGNIDIALDNEETLSLGVSEGFAFASVNQSGDITPYTQAPEILSVGFNNVEVDTTQEADSETTEVTTVATPDAITETTTSPLLESSITEESTQPDEYAQTASETNDQEIIDEQMEEPVVDIEDPIEEIDDIQTIAELISERTGIFNYEEITQSEVTSSIGNATDLSLNLAVDFDNGIVPGGSLSVTDEQGEWFASYSGLINVDELELNVNFASHGNNRAEGNISAAFTDGLEEISGQFNLQEVEDTSVSTEGSFQIK